MQSSSNPEAIREATPLRCHVATRVRHAVCTPNAHAIEQQPKKAYVLLGVEGSRPRVAELEERVAQLYSRDSARLMGEAISAPQRSSALLSAHQRSSALIRGHQRSSEVIRGHQRETVSACMQTRRGTRDAHTCAIEEGTCACNDMHQRTSRMQWHYMQLHAIACACHDMQQRTSRMYTCPLQSCSKSSRMDRSTSSASHVSMRRRYTRVKSCE